MSDERTVYLAKVLTEEQRDTLAETLGAAEQAYPCRTPCEHRACIETVARRDFARSLKRAIVRTEEAKNG